MGEGARTRSDYNPSYVTRNGDILNCKFLGRGPRPRRGLPCENLKWKRTANPRECAVCLSKGNASRTDDARDDDDEGRNGEQKKKKKELRVESRKSITVFAAAGRGVLVEASKVVLITLTL